LIELLIGLVILWVMAGPLILWRIERNRRLEDAANYQDQLKEFGWRVTLLESSIESLKKLGVAPPRSAPPPTTEPQPKTRDSGVPIPAQPQQPPAAVRTLAVERAQAATYAASAPSMPTTVSHPASQSVTRTQTQSASEPLRSSQSGPVEELLRTEHAGLKLEETLGTNWLNKLGIVILVLGISFFLAYQLKTMGPAGKVLVGYVTSGLLLGAGLWFERSERYRLLARAGMAGGWALLFFTTYAMYHVPATHVLSSQVTDLVLMMGVAIGMVWHTLRYRSQVLTGLAFFLAYLTVTISHVSVYSLSAGAVLALGLVGVALRMHWFELEICGIAASYLNHYLWLRPIIAPMQGHKHVFPEFGASAAILILYWLIYRVSYVLRMPEKPEQERISSFAALFNVSLLLLLLKYQSVHPEWAFWALLAIGSIETALAQLPISRRRRTAFFVLCTIGIVLLISAFPFRYSGARLSVLWLLQAEALLLIGIWTKEALFRRLGILAAGVAAGHMIALDAARIVGMRMDGAYVHSDFRIALMFFVASISFYVDSHWLTRRWPDLFNSKIDNALARALSEVAAAMAFIAAWIAFPAAWTAPVWAVLALGLFSIGRKWSIPQLELQSNLVSAAAVLRIFSENLSATQAHYGLTERLITVSLVAAVLYVRSRWSVSVTERMIHVGSFAYPLSRAVADAFTWTASFLLTLLGWYELRSMDVAIAWVMGGLLLLEIGLRRQSISLRLQALILFVAGFLRIFIVNVNASGAPGEISPRLYTIVPLIFAFYYAYYRVLHDLDIPDAAAGLCYLGTITTAALMRFELTPDWVAAGWSAFAIVLLALAWRNGRSIFLQQAVIIAVAVLFRTILHNFYERSYFPAPAWETRWLCAGAVVLLLLAGLPLAMELRRKEQVDEAVGRFIRLWRAALRRPEQVFFFTALILLTVLLALEMRHGMVTVAWGIEAVGVFLLALWLAERSFRLAGLGLLLLCVGKIVVIDVWRLNPRDRYLTFIILGCALLLVSFLYTRHREALRQYL
jgi:uncharacterized membrane protein